MAWNISEVRKNAQSKPLGALHIEIRAGGFPRDAQYRIAPRQQSVCHRVLVFAEDFVRGDPAAGSTNDRQREPLAYHRQMALLIDGKRKALEPLAIGRDLVWITSGAGRVRAADHDQHR